MLIAIKTGTRVDRLGRIWTHELIMLRCDTCGVEWETRGSKTRIASRKTHACSPECKSKAHKNSGVVERLRAATNMDRYGAENAFAAKSCKEKSKITMLEHHGVEHALQSSDLLRKQKETTIDRYGEHPMGSDVIQDRTKKTMLERHGVEHPMQMQSVRDAMMAGSVVKYGVPYPTQNSSVMSDILDKRYVTIQVKGGKAYQSKPEQAFRALLEGRFGVDDVFVQQRLARKWSIDFYVKSVNTYVQFDGVYWHGLDRPIEVIKESLNNRDKIIYGKWIKDRELDRYVSEKGLRLVRITDREFEEDPAACLLKISTSWVGSSSLHAN